MLTLIAESKSMCPQLIDIKPSTLALNQPAFGATATDIMLSLSGKSSMQFSHELGLGPKSSEALFRNIYDFPNKVTGLEAVESYTGVVFKSFDFKSLDNVSKEFAIANVRIISSLYGWLHLTDIVKPYRLDFGMKIAPGGGSLMNYWKRHLTVKLINTLHERGDHEVLNLLPMDASKCIDWKIVKKFAKIYIANFRQQDGNKLRTPNATRLKELRGELLRHISEDHISTASELREIQSTDFFYEKDSPYPGHLMFISA